MTLRTPLTTLLDVRHPVVLAAMDVVADARLSLAVMDAGGYAFLGGGYGDERWLRDQLALLAPAARERRRGFGVGFITWSLAKQPHLLDIALAEKPSAIWLSFGDPAPFADRIRAAGAKLVCQVHSDAMAQAALDAGADALVAAGAEGGGHGATRGTLAIVPAIVDRAAGRIPVLAAGGIADGRGLAAALMLGAAGVALGTRLYATEEAAAHPRAKERVVRAGGDDSVRSIVFDISRNNVWPAPFTGRCLRNPHLERWLGREVELMRELRTEGPRYLEARAAGDFDTAAVIAGEAAALVRDVPPAGAVIERMVAEATALLSGAPGLTHG